MFTPTAPAQQVHDTTVTVRRTVKGGEESATDTTLDTRVFAVQPAVVKAQCSRTINTGNFESLKIEVGVEMPCYPEEVAEALTAVTDLVGGFLQREEAAVRQAIAKGKAA